MSFAGHEEKGRRRGGVGELRIGDAVVNIPWWMLDACSIV